MDCTVYKIKEGINKAGLQKLAVKKDITLIETYTANNTTGIIAHNSGWHHVAGVTEPIDNNNGKIKAITYNQECFDLIKMLKVFCFSEYDTENNIYELNTNYGNDGVVDLLTNPEVEIRNDVKYITIRCTTIDNSDYSDTIGDTILLKKHLYL